MGTSNTIERRYDYTLCTTFQLITLSTLQDNLLRQCFINRWNCLLSVTNPNLS